MKFNRRVFYRFIFNIFLVFLVCISGCSIGSENIFPDVNIDTKIPLPSANGNETEIIPQGTIHLALPMDEECTEHLVYLFFHDYYLGLNNQEEPDYPLNISLNRLKSLSEGIVPVTEKISPLGYSNEQILSMKNSGSLPDVFIAQNIDYIIHNQEGFIDLSGEFLDGYMDFNKIYPHVFYNGGISGSTPFIPYHLRVMMLFFNRSVIGDVLLDPLLFDYPISFDSVLDISQSISENQILPWSDFRNLSLFLPGTIEPLFFNVFDYTYENRFEFNNSSKIRSLELIRSLAQLAENEDEMQSAFSIDYSDSGMDDLFLAEEISRFPIPVVDKTSIPLSAVNIVARKNTFPDDFTGKLAVYIALSENSAYFRSRYDMPEGFILPMKNPDIWNKTVLSQRYGSDLYLIRNFMTNSFLIDPLKENTIRENYNILYDNYIYDILFSGASIEQNLTAMNQTAKEVFVIE